MMCTFTNGPRQRAPGDRLRASPRSALSALILGLALVLLPGCGSTPEWQGMGPDELYSYAQAAFAEEEYEDAIAALERLVASYPAFAQIVEARLLLAESFFEREEYLSAASDFERILQRYGRSPLAPRAALGMCRSYVELSPRPQRDQTYTEQAAVACGNVAADYAGTPEGEEAAELEARMIAKLAEADYVVAEYYIKREWYDSAIIYLEDIAERYPDTPWAPRALMTMAEAYEEIGWEEEAEETRQRILSQYPDSPEASRLGNGDDGG